MTMTTTTKTGTNNSGINSMREANSKGKLKLTKAQSTALDVTVESTLAQAQSTIHNAITLSQISPGAIAQALGTQKVNITRLLDASCNLQIRTLARVLFLCGYKVEFKLTKIQTI
jgi:hypothetical protein